MGASRILTRIRNQVRLELVQVDVEGAIEAERGGNRGNNLSDQTVEMLIGWARDIQVALADIINRLVVDQESTIRVLDGAVRRQDGVVRLNNGSGNARGRVDSKLELALLRKVLRKTLKKERTKSRSSTTAERVENQESLQAGAVVYHKVSINSISPTTDAGYHEPVTRRMRSNTVSASSLPIV